MSLYAVVPSGQETQAMIDASTSSSLVVVRLSVDGTKRLFEWEGESAVFDDYLPHYSLEDVKANVSWQYEGDVDPEEKRTEIEDDLIAYGFTWTI